MTGILAVLAAVLMACAGRGQTDGTPAIMINFELVAMSRENKIGISVDFTSCDDHL